MIKERFFGFLYLPFFQEKAQNKSKVGIKTTFLLMMTILKAKSPTPVHFHLGRDERIFLKSEKQQTNIIWTKSSGRNINGGPITANHSMCHNTREYNPVVDYLARLNSTFKKQHVSFNQLLDFLLQRETVLDVMAGSSLMEGTREVRLIPYWQLVRHLRRRSGLDKVLLEQDGKQLRICHWD